ncbi:MAG: porin family protein [Ferruginibacter sp.]
MKKIFLYSTIVIILSVSLQIAFAQKGFDLGIRYLLTESALYNKSDKNSSAIKRESTLSYFSGGIALGYNFNRHMGIELDILHSRQGQEFSGMNTLNSTGNAFNHEVAIIASANNDQTAGAYQAKAELNMLKIPVLLRLSTDNSKPFYFHVNVGPQLDFLQSAVFEYNGEDVELPGTGIEPKDVYRKLTIDGVLGVGAGFKMSKHWNLLAQARFDYGVQDVEKKNSTYSFNNVQQPYYGNGRDATHNATAALMVGFNYKF